ncbi:MAG: transglutaminase family protein [Caulobacteraceae bacterium]
MRITIHHVTSYEYQSPAKSVVQLLRLTPRPHEGQRVARWRIDLDVDARLHRSEDAFGNITHTLFLSGPLPRLSLTVEGEVETWETHGVVRDAIERFVPEVFLRHTPLTPDRPEAGEFRARRRRPARARRPRAAPRPDGGGQPRGRLRYRADPDHHHAVEAFAMRRGVCQDLAHIFIAGARVIGAPARYVSGHLVRIDGVVEQEAAHAWAEAYVPDLGWVAFDPANGVCATPGYVRVAVGLDYLSAAPVRGSRIGGGQERLDVKLKVSHAASQTQA